MATTYVTECANCGTDATMRCSGCIDAPDYQPGDSTGIAYCNRDCQKTHWPTHKTHCSVMRQRKKLLRAATILKATFLAYRETQYDIDLTKIDLQDGVLRLHEVPRALPKPGLFPTHLTSCVEHKEAALAVNQCTTALALAGGLTHKLLAGLPLTIENLDIHIGKPLLPTMRVQGPDNSSCPHSVLKVTRLFSHEKWIIDTAGCQYGFRDVLVPYDTYMAEKACRIVNEPTTYDWTETKDLDFFATLPQLTRFRAQRQAMESERKARLRFAAFVDSRVGKDFLDGSDADFRQRLDGFVDELKKHMSGVGK